MANALAVKAANLPAVARVNVTRESMLKSCWETNRWARKIKLDRWYHVTDDDGRLGYAIKHGDDVRMMWAMMDGAKPDYAGWTPEKNFSEFKILRWLVRNGMTPDDYELTALGGN